MLILIKLIITELTEDYLVNYIQRRIRENEEDIEISHWNELFFRMLEEEEEENPVPPTSDNLLYIIIGAVVGGLLIIIIIVVSVVLAKKKKKTKLSKKTSKQPKHELLEETETMHQNFNRNTTPYKNEKEKREKSPELEVQFDNQPEQIVTRKHYVPLSQQQLIKRQQFVRSQVKVSQINKQIDSQLSQIQTQGAPARLMEIIDQHERPVEGPLMNFISPRIKKGQKIKKIVKIRKIDYQQDDEMINVRKQLETI